MQSKFSVWITYTKSKICLQYVNVFKLKMKSKYYVLLQDESIYDSCIIWK